MIHPLYVDIRATRDLSDADQALEALTSLDVERAFIGPGWLLGDRWPAALRAWDGRLMFHHACFEKPDAVRWNLSADTEEVRRTSVDAACETLRVAAGLGAPVYSVEAGWAIAFTRDGNNQPVGTHTPLPRARDQLARSLDRLATLADERGILLALATTPQHKQSQAVVAEPEALLALLEKLQATPLGVLFDTPSMVETARFRNEDPVPYTDALRGWVRAIALHHGDGKGERFKLLKENDVELELARRAGGLVHPTVIRARAVEPAALRDQIAMARELIMPQPTVAENRP